MNAIQGRTSTGNAAIVVTKTTLGLTYMVGAALLFVCASWLVQADMFTGVDANSAKVLWTLMASGVAGFGAALLFAAYKWFQPKAS